MLKSLLVCISIFTVSGLLESVAQGEPTFVREWEFKVLLNDKEVGTHIFRVTDEGESTTVKSDAAFDVKILFFNAYSYRHSCVEIWDELGLVSIESSTDANGDDFKVNGKRLDDHFLVSNRDGESKLAAQPYSFAYWNPEILTKTQLVNAQTGEYEVVEVTEAPSQPVDYQGNQLEAKRYDILVKDQIISVWYGADDMRWLALESPAKGGRVIRYEPVRLPEVPEPEPGDQVKLNTDAGSVLLDIYDDRAPLTAANFLKYVDEGRFEGATFYRVVTLTNQPDNDVKIEVIQGGLSFSGEHPNNRAPIRHETTEETGILHKDGVISMARVEPGTAAGEFFICIGDQPELDYGGKRNPDGQGFAAFGRVVEGMDVVRKIQQQPEADQMLIEPVKILSVVRVEWGSYRRTWIIDFNK